jgi:NAD(P)-dependent dehydrogenase (short-subunit alcohol dehydrogenase family)
MTQAGDIAVITGTTHGIGRVTSRELARAGYTVVMLCRDVAAARTVEREIREQAPAASVQTVRCDLASLGSVRECAAEVRSSFGPIRVLVNNAGMASWRHRMSVDGFELTFATNHLGPFLLTHLLLDRMDEQCGRIVTVASRAHARGRLDLDRVRDPKAPYRGMTAYAQSKLANVLHTFALARRLAASRVTANCLHPGVVATNLFPKWLRLAQPLMRRMIFDAERGARTTLHLALANEVAGISGRYFDENQKAQPASALANDLELQELLWRRSAAWVGVDQNHS